MTIKDYDNELLHMAHDLAVRLLPAFENTKTGIPYPRVRRLIPYPRVRRLLPPSPRMKLSVEQRIWGEERG